MKTITATELKSILDQHQLWIETNGKEGVCANLTDANLAGANLRYAILTGAKLTDANLTGANLTGTILDKKAEKKAEIASVKPESSIRSEIEAIAKKHGMKIDSIALSFL
jgi:fructose-specific phosphotransferase system component IIB